MNSEHSLPFKQKLTSVCLLLSSYAKPFLFWPAFFWRCFTTVSIERASRRVRFMTSCVQPCPCVTMSSSAFSFPCTLFSLSCSSLESVLDSNLSERRWSFAVSVLGTMMCWSLNKASAAVLVEIGSTIASLIHRIGKTPKLKQKKPLKDDDGRGDMRISCPRIFSLRPVKEFVLGQEK